MSVTHKIFDGLTAAETEEILNSISKATTFKKGDELYKNGKVALLKSGKATIRRISLTGQPLMIRSLGENEIFGAASIFGEWKKGASSIIAETDGEIIYIDESDFRELLIKNEKVTFNYIAFLTERIRFLNRRIDAFSAGSTEQRLYEFLLSNKDEKGVFTLTTSMSKLSSMLNVGRTSLYRDISSLESKGLIERKAKKIYVK